MLFSMANWLIPRCELKKINNILANKLKKYGSFNKNNSRSDYYSSLSSEI